MLPSRRCLLGSLALVLLATAGPLAAQDYPSRRIRLVLAQAPDSGADAVGRMLAEFLSRDLKQPVDVENKPGANGIVASEMVHGATADGYTLLLTSVSVVSFNPFLYPDMPYDALKDFTFIAPVADAAFVLVASPASGIRNWDDLVQRAKARPQELTFASGGLGNVTHLYAEMIAHRSGLKLRHLPYKSTGPALMAVVAGEADVMVATTAAGLAQIRGGKVVGIAQSGATRAPELPNLPLLKELAPDLPVLPGWYALVAPAGIEEKVSDRLADSVSLFLSDPEMQGRLADQFLFPLPGTPADIRQRAEAESRIWGELIRDLKIHAD